MRLRGQYTLVIGGLVFSSLTVFGVALLAEQRRYAGEVGAVVTEFLQHSIEREARSQGVALASGLATHLSTSLARNDLRLVLHETAELRRYPHVDSATVVDAQGIPIRDLPDDDFPAHPLSDHAWVREALTSGVITSHRSGTVIQVAAPVVDGAKVLGAVVLQLTPDSIVEDMEFERTRLDQLVRAQSSSFALTSIALGLLLVTISFLAAAQVAGRLSRPVVQFAKRARRIGRGEPLHAPSPQRRDELGDLSAAFDEMAATLARTTVSKDYFDNVLRSMADMLLVVDAHGNIVTANPSCIAELGCDEASLRGTSLRSLLPDFDPFAEVPAATVQPRPWHLLKAPGGGELPVRIAAAPLQESDGVFAGHVLVMQDVSGRLAAQEQSERSLAEKEILIREIHHRVKNNLQIISSMLSLQKNRSTDEHIREVFQESEARIRAMALVHEQLYRSDDPAVVDVAVYLETLGRQVLRYFGRSDCTMEVTVDQAVREVSVDGAIPIGLIVNELVANSVQHGFGDSRSGHVRVELTGSANGAELRVSDNGAGFPERFDIEVTETLGLKLVQALTDQLGGSFSITRDGGARCTVTFPFTALRRVSAPARTVAV